MPMLGDLLAAARASAGGFQSWLQASDSDLAAAVSVAAARDCLTVAGFARSAVAEFSRLAGEEDWATLISSLRDSDDPGTICLLAMVHWRLTVTGCGEHSLRPHHSHPGAADERPEKRPAH